MLIALELAGFKSFADKTRFDFPDGITVVVGPNGSGKSNIVDAIKWVLGSQSAKSLRGQEMADVIFKGSQSRAPAGSAEATIVFDNRSGTLPIDTEEVHVTRRVFRSGEGEYLINGQACRLKDVKGLIAGTGIGIDSYSLIEQGKVDRMLQANSKDRRAIFEEAAGISRFKAKKVEAERRLGRVSQNLVRLSDIVDEVASRLHSLKTQANKAERYRTASERLRELRTSLAWTDWAHLSAEITEAEADLQVATTDQQTERHRLAEITRQREEAESVLQRRAAEVQDLESARAEVTRRIATVSGRREVGRATLMDLEAAIRKGRQRLQTLRSQAGLTAAEFRATRDRLSDYQEELKNATKQVQHAEQVRDKAHVQAERMRAQREETQIAQLSALRKVADVEGKVQRKQQQFAESERSLENLNRRLAAAEASLAESQKQGTLQQANLAQLDRRIAESTKAIEVDMAKFKETRRVLDRRREEIASFNVRLQGVNERFKILDSLRQRHEGITGGVKSLLDQLQQSDDGLNTDFLGIVAEQFQSDVSVAPLIDASLGPLAQYAIVRGDRIHRALLTGGLHIIGRVGLLRIDELPQRRPGDKIRLNGLTGVIGRADRMLQTQPELEPLARHLLGTTWFVDSLETAFGLRKLSGAGLRFVTSGCELLDRDGSIVVGPADAAAGLVSRNSERLAALDEIKHYRYQLTEAEAEADRLTKRVDEEEAQLGRKEDAHRQDVTQHAAVQATVQHSRQRIESQQQVRDDLIAEIEVQNKARQESVTQLAALRQQLAECRESIGGLESEALVCDQQLGDAESDLQRATSTVMALSVDLARAEQKVESVSAALEALQRDQAEREEGIQEILSRIQEDQQRGAILSEQILAAGSRLATSQLEEEEIDQQLTRLAESRVAEQLEQQQRQRDVDAASRAVNEATEQLHAISGRRDRAQLRRDTLSDRLLEDYEIDLRASEPPQDLEPLEDRDAVEKEITDLRERLQRVGSVNMEALEELQELQTRYDELHGQYQDLTASKESLERMIQKINVDSRRLFMDTLEAIRQNFQRLYRKSFGGGTADLILEESEDPLEAGVEIVATPPGKPSFSNSLLSGGEKALTAVALLMSIFQYRPSPFCVLDEVDAPFDEANIGRFVTVLNQFLDHSKFVIVTHSKKTMVAATTLYGVTMQESGISKQVSVRFEDVSEDDQTHSDLDDRGVA